MVSNATILYCLHNAVLFYFCCFVKKQIRKEKPFLRSKYMLGIIKAKVETSFHFVKKNI
jgi:hypothetical protein